MINYLKKHHGQTLIELIIFIVIMGIMITGAMRVFQTVLLKSNQPGHILTAAQLANARMELIVQTRHLPDDATGFTNLSDPCNDATLAACAGLHAFATSRGYVVTSSPNPIVGTVDDDGSNKTVTITVTGAGDATNIMRFAQ